MAFIDLGLVYTGKFRRIYPPELASLENGLQALDGTEPEIHQLQGYAGPNDVIQLLVDASSWGKIVTFFLAAVTTGFGVRLGNKLMDRAWKEKSTYEKLAKVDPFPKIIQAVTDIRSKGQEVAIAVRLPRSGGRNAGVRITSEDPVDIVWQIAIVARYAEEIAERGAKYCNTPQDYDLRDVQTCDHHCVSVTVEVLEDGRVRLLGELIDK